MPLEGSRERITYIQPHDIISKGKHYLHSEVGQIMTTKPVSYTHLDVYKRQPLNLAWGIIVLSSVLIWNMAPVQSINRELDADEKKHCRKVAVKIIVGIYVFAGICTLTGMNAIVSLVAVTMAAVLISQYIGVVKYKIEKR